MKRPALKSEETFAIESHNGIFSMIKVIPLSADIDGPFVYDLFQNDIGFFYSRETAQDLTPSNMRSNDRSKADYLGQILFDQHGYWIYDGNHLDISEQEQLAEFIASFNAHQAMNNHKDDELRYL